MSRVNVNQFYRIIFLITQNISKHSNCKRIMTGRNHVTQDVGAKIKGVVLHRMGSGFGILEFKINQFII